MVLRGVVGCKGQTITGRWIDVCNGELHYMLSLVEQIFINFFHI